MKLYHNKGGVGVMKKKEKGFTLVELLAVIVILAIILVIAVPKVMNIISDAKKGTLESTAKMIASQAEKQKVQNAILGKTEEITCDSVTKLNNVDYESCSIIFDDDIAKVTIIGSGKFEGLNVCSGTKINAIAGNEECSLVCKSNEVENVSVVAEKTNGYEVADSESCVSYTKDYFLTTWYYDSENELKAVCNSKTDEDAAWFDELIFSMVAYGGYTEKELIENNVIKGTIIKKCIPTTKAECFDFDSTTGTILYYYKHENNDETKPACPLDVIIPNKINGISINKIDNYAFTTCTTKWCQHYTEGLGIKSVIIQEGVKEIGEYAFYDNEITSVKLPNSITTLGPDAFRGNVISGTLDLSNTKLETIGGSAFLNNQINKLRLPNDLIEIGIDAFRHNQIGGELDLSKLDKLETIGNFAFSYNQITSVKLPSSVTTIGWRAFYKDGTSNPNLTSITNPSVKSFDWNDITEQGTSSTCTFATGSCGSITISAN